MMGWVRIGLLALCFAFAWVGSAALAAEEGAAKGSEAKAVPQTAPAIPAAGEEEKPLIEESELKDLLRPLFKEELEVEAEAWLTYLQWKVRQLTKLKIERGTLNRKIEAAEETADKVEEKAEEKAEAAEEKAEEAEEKAEAAEEKAEEVDSDKKAQEKKNTETGLKPEEQEKPKTATESETGKVVQAGPAGEAEGQPKQAAVAAEQVVAAQAKVDATTEEKSEVDEEIVEADTEQAALIRRVEMVLDALEEKGGDVALQRKYVAAVSGGPEINLAEDPNAIVTYLKGWLMSEEGGLRWARNICAFLVMLVVFWTLSVLLGKAVDRSLGRSRRASALLKSFVSKLVRRVILLVGLLVALAYLEVNLGPILAVIGGASLVVAFALQDTLGNFASGILILFYRPFDVHDLIEAGGVSGTVDSMNLVSTHIKTLDNKLMVVPNSTVWSGVITNATGTTQRRVDMVFGIGYDDDIDKTLGILTSIVAGHELVLKEPEPIIQLHELADSSVNFVCRPWVRTADYWTVYWDITKEVKKRFDAEGVSIPFPQRDVHVIHEGTAAD